MAYIWNLWPYTLITWPFAWALNLLLFGFWIITAWTEVVWNTYVFINFGIDVLLSPYYITMAFLTVYEALGSRPQYLADLPEGAKKLLEFAGLDDLLK